MEQLLQLLQLQQQSFLAQLATPCRATVECSNVSEPVMVHASRGVNSLRLSAYGVWRRSWMLPDPVHRGASLQGCG
jgi:hypothetical protein